MNKTVVRVNLEKMRDSRPGGLMACLLGESLGGNAGTENGLPCGGANFYADPIHGFILYFGNKQDVPAIVKENALHGRMRVALRMDRPSTRINSLHYDPDFSPEAKANLEKSIHCYNQKYGFDV